MRRLRLLALFLCYLAVLGLANYELTAKSPRLLGQPLPGWRECRQVERCVRMHRRTGLPLVDRLLHEGEEALQFYNLLLGRTPVSPTLPPLEIP